MKIYIVEAHVKLQLPVIANSVAEAKTLALENAHDDEVLSYIDKDNLKQHVRIDAVLPIPPGELTADLQGMFPWVQTGVDDELEDRLGWEYLEKELNWLDMPLSRWLKLLQSGK